MDLAESAKSWFSNKDVFNGTIGGLLTAAIMALPLYAARLGRFLVRWMRIGILWRLLFVNLGWLVVIWLIPEKYHVNITLALVLVGAIASTFLIYHPFQKLGLVDAHAKTRSGIDFAASLKMARSSIEFLGIGADKLTNLPEFEQAMMRCATSGNCARFLLSPIDNPALERAARRNNVNPSAYKNNVRESLRRISRLKREKNLNIEVRTYPASADKDLQQFRLMFIDGSICLAGWTVWGAHIGKENPQIVFQRHTRLHPDITAYKAFHDYFESLWADPGTKKVNLDKIV